MSRGAILQTLVDTVSQIGGKVLRNASIPPLIPVDGLVIVRDGEPGEPSKFFGGPYLIEHYSHTVEVEIYSASNTPEADIYNISDEIAALVRADRTLGGAVDACSVGATTVAAVPVEDGAPLVVGMVPIVLRYTMEVAA